MMLQAILEKKLKYNIAEFTRLDKAFFGKVTSTTELRKNPTTPVMRTTNAYTTQNIEIVGLFFSMLWHKIPAILMRNNDTQIPSSLLFDMVPGVTHGRWLKF
jgi:hypothetical protein